MTMHHPSSDLVVDIVSFGRVLCAPLGDGNDGERVRGVLVYLLVMRPSRERLLLTQSLGLGRSESMYTHTHM